MASEASDGTESLVRMSYCELYMEKVNDLLRKIGPQSQNLLVKEDPETKGFYAEGLKEKIVSCQEEAFKKGLDKGPRKEPCHRSFTSNNASEYDVI